ncbi:pyruvate ferredoxin oxidoreductase, beta subunit [Archaeoglobus sulfaticallidus PM70-1]|uniref:Pyruvate ferredoxin oxidoreductase, beta subunit n=1 Tax=Archaeoglobus sulfaticallidus PM70-1 TaxID=387631 RepID=N0BBG8_9EURY|nr:thiamine pyrophosphate-dependent enzyme [Archaeoglobus sulfaticallidus]AGK60353.1 pyruvate ferredoxin oxidoreductase, beta subunit [Archaeoglobus sulfaticallidus PM70-1]
MTYFASGHGACPGCGLAIAVRNVLDALEGKCFVANSTGCLEIISSQYERSAWGVPYIHSLFENAGAVAAGIELALKALKRTDEGKVVVFAGDGATADIGIGTLSGMMDRNHDVIYICLDNEAYQNTGNQQSGLTPMGSNTTTTPAGAIMLGKTGRKKDMISIAVAHGLPYVASASVAFHADIRRKVKKAAEIEGAKYIQIHTPCVTGWGIDGKQTITSAKLAYETALYPIVEFENGELTRVRKIKERKPVEEYLKIQRRFRHLFKHPRGQEIINLIQKIADENAKKYNLDL